VSGPGWAGRLEKFLKPAALIAAHPEVKCRIRQCRLRRLIRKDCHRWLLWSSDS